MLGIKCPVGYVYALYYKNKPFYIGQTKKTLKERLKYHKYFIFNTNKNSDLCSFVRSISNEDNFYELISIRPIKIVSYNELKYQETQIIKYCIDRGLKIYNSCVITISYKSTKLK